MSNESLGNDNVGEVIRFLLTGALSNGISYLLFLIAVYVLGVGHKTTATILFFIGLAINFSVNRKWTFRSRKSYTKNYLKFITTYFLGYFINIMLLAIAVDYLNYQASFGQIVAIIILTIYYFIMNKFYIYK
jgi:putative flippase GtrA